MLLIEENISSLENWVCEESNTLPSLVITGFGLVTKIIIIPNLFQNI